MESAVLPKDKFMEWVERNPLRIWRIENNVSMAQISGMIEVSVTSIARWEFGSTVPSKSGMDKLALILGDSIRTNWAKWTTARLA
jgi:transcriptional regulator with XRE-family HTH domain